MRSWIMRLSLVFGLALLCFISSPLPPSAIVVGHRVFKVYYSDEIEATPYGKHGYIYAMTNCKDVHGGAEDYIEVDLRQNYWEMQDTIWHEAHHAANNCGTLTGALAEDADYDFDNLYEEQIPQELQLMKQNPEMISFIQAKGTIWQRWFVKLVFRYQRMRAQ